MNLKREKKGVTAAAVIIIAVVFFKQNKKHSDENFHIYTWILITIMCVQFELKSHGKQRSGEKE